MVNASSIVGKGIFFSRHKLACNELVSIASHRSFSFKISLIIPSLTSYLLASSFCFKRGADIFFKHISFFCAAVKDLRFLGASLSCFLEFTGVVFGILKKEVE